MSAMKLEYLVLEQTCAAAFVSPSAVATIVPAEGGCSAIPGGGSAAREAVPGAAARIPRAGARGDQFGAEWCQKAREILDTLQKYSAVGELGKALERRLWCDLGYSVHTRGRRVKVALRLPGENGL
jgi:hypothetical protein